MYCIVSGKKPSRAPASAEWISIRNPLKLGLVKDFIGWCNITNREREIGELIAKAMENVGKEGVITISDGKTLHNELEVVEGLKLDRRYISPYFITNQKNKKCTQRHLLIVVEDVESDALAMLILNKLRVGIKVTVILDGADDKKSIEERYEQLRSAIELSTSDYDEEKLQERLAKLSGGGVVLKYTTSIDIWSIGCIFAEVLTGKPFFPGKNVVHQLDLMTDLLGTPSLDTVSRVRNEKARRNLSSMRKKQPVPFTQKFPNADPLALKLLERLLAFDPKDRPTAEEALADPYFKGLAKAEREPSCQPITKSTIVHSTAIPPKEQPPAFARFKERQVPDDSCRNSRDMDEWTIDLQRSQATQRIPLAKPGKVVGPVVPYENRTIKEPCDLRRLIRNTAFPAQPAVHSAYCFHRNAVKPEGSDRDMVAKVAHEFAWM
ncbi:Mitogen-activated protein kinase 10 [Acorus calamus]|uniref:Mitogen-activated protein kinase 10 n=1 Tax=Acorus calamus TaxID=4465 RepID=A0AAV9DNW2_ACOCL|nr:Mitogen-activated protein kinase 10 [Acorus calamus]